MLGNNANSSSLSTHSQYAHADRPYHEKSMTKNAFAYNSMARFNKYNQSQLRNTSDNISPSANQPNNDDLDVWTSYSFIAKNSAQIDRISL